MTNKKYKMTILKRYAEKNAREIAKGYFKYGKGPKKDKRSKNITAADKKRAIKAFLNDAEGIVENNPEMSASEIYDKVTHTTKFSEKGSRMAENFFKQTREFGFTFQRRSMEWDKEKDMYKITRGENKGKYLKIVHNPGQEPSITIILVD